MDRPGFCQSCLPPKKLQTCDNCVNPSKILRSIHTRRKIFYAIAESTCHECGTTDVKVNAEGTCHACTPSFFGNYQVCDECYNALDSYCAECHRKTEEVNERSICAACEFGTDWVTDSGRIRLQQCADCGTSAILSNEGLCKSCHAVRKAKSFGFNYRKCKGCATVISGSAASYCLDCMLLTRKCKNCGELFIPHVAEQQMCEKCLNICPSCGNVTESPDFCASCDADTRTYD